MKVFGNLCQEHFHSHLISHSQPQNKQFLHHLPLGPAQFLASRSHFADLLSQETARTPHHLCGTEAQELQNEHARGMEHSNTAPPFRISSQAKIFSPLLFWRVESHMLPFSKCHVVYIWPSFYSCGSCHQIRRAVSQMGNVTTQGPHREEKFGVTGTSFTSEPNSGLSFD